MRNDRPLASLRSTLGLAAVATGLIALTPGAASGQATCAQLQKLLPASPTHAYTPPPFKNQPGTGCIGLYWIRVTKMSTIMGLHEFGAQVAIFLDASPAAAKQKIPRMGRPVAYGDGGMERIELPGATDLRRPTAEEAKTGTFMEESGFDAITKDDGGYAAYFSCGPYLATVFANPTWADGARKLIPDLVANLRSVNPCGSETVTAGVPSAPPPPPVTPATEDARGSGGTRYYEGTDAQRILEAAKKGSRYMVVVSRTWDPAQKCFLEVRAWVSGIRASDGGKVAVQTGPTRTVCVKDDILSAAAVNGAEGILQTTRNEYAKALKAKQDLQSYLKSNDPAVRAWAAGKAQELDGWIRQYEKDIAELQAAVAAATP